MVIVESPNCVDAETQARAAAKETGQAFISPYNDIRVIMGQGTIGLEIYEQLEGQELDAIFVSVGGGGLISGVGLYLKSILPSCEIVGCQPLNSNVMQSLQAGRILTDVEELPTLSDGTAGGIEDSITFGICQNVVDRFVTVSEGEIAAAMLWSLEKEKMTIEGAAAVVIAALQKDLERYQGKTVALLLCGRNVSETVLQSLQEKRDLAH